jgi:hypothetical protein
MLFATATIENSIRSGCGASITVQHCCMGLQHVRLTHCQQGSSMHSRLGCPCSIERLLGMPQGLVEPAGGLL